MAAEQAGFELTKWTLRRLCGLGLVPPPSRTGQRGLSPQWTYPPSTDTRLVALLRQRQHTKDPNVLRVALWVDGFQIPEADVRASLGRWLRAMLDGVGRELRAYARKYGLDVDTQSGRRQALQGVATVLAAKRGREAVPRYGRVPAAERAHGLAVLMEVFGLGEPNAGGTGDAEADGQSAERVLGIVNGRRIRIDGQGP